MEQTGKARRSPSSVTQSDGEVGCITEKDAGLNGVLRHRAGWERAIGQSGSLVRAVFKLFLHWPGLCIDGYLNVETAKIVTIDIRATHLVR
jgi:hypothetical protein